MLVDIAICAADPMKAVIAAAPLRRSGASVVTQFNGKLSRQIERAHAVAASVFVVDGAGLRQIHRGSISALRAVFGSPDAS